MIKELTIYTCICDVCGNESERNSIECVEEIAVDKNWIVDKGKHICYDCHSYDNKNKVIIIKSKKPKQIEKT